MRQELINILTDLTPEEFSGLIHSVSMAYNTRNKMREHQITIGELSKITGFSEDEIFMFLCGTLDKGFDFITKIEYAIMDIVDEKSGRKSVKDLLKKDSKDS